LGFRNLQEKLEKRFEIKPRLKSIFLFLGQRRDASPDCWQHDKFQEVAEDNNGNE
jgi:hypothetical protein